MASNNEDIKIGVFICHCGSNIAGYLAMEDLEEYAKTLPNVTLHNEEPLHLLRGRYQ